MVDNEWREKAEQNVDEHGLERPAQLVLLMAEELGELASEVAESSERTEFGMTQRHEQAERELRRIIDTGGCAKRFCDDVMDGDRNPQILGDVTDEEAIRDELDDLAALCVQMGQSIETYNAERKG